jgi:uracil-DNA glycosylase family 4
MIPAIRPEHVRLLDLIEDYFRDGLRRAQAGDPQPASGSQPASDSRLAGDLRPAAPQPTDSRPAVPDPGSRLAEVARAVADCRRCPLHRGRKRTVPGEGVINPQVLVVGEGPGAEENATGRPFVGKAGQYLDKWLKAIDLDRTSNCYIANIVKCRPPGNRDPLPEESEACLPYLQEQIAALRPRAILAVGRIAAQVLTGRAVGIGELRSLEHDFGGIPLVATYHPSAVLRDPSLRAPVWEDLKRLNALLGHA